MLDYVKVDQDSDPYSIAHTIALNALVARAKSKGEILAHLKKRGIDQEVAQATVFRLQEAGLINDAEFAKAWTQSRHNAKKKSNVGCIRKNQKTSISCIMNLKLGV